MPITEKEKIIISTLEEKLALFRGFYNTFFCRDTKSSEISAIEKLLRNGALRLLVGTSMYLSITRVSYKNEPSGKCKWCSDTRQCMKDRVEAKSCLCQGAQKDSEGKPVWTSFNASLENRIEMEYFCNMVTEANNQLEIPEKYKDLIEQLIFAGGKKKLQKNLSVSEIYEENKQMTSLLQRGFPTFCVMCGGELTTRQVLLHNVAYCTKCCG